jgi:hypothetical protein
MNNVIFGHSTLQEMERVQFFSHEDSDYILFTGIENIITIIIRLFLYVDII